MEKGVKDREKEREVEKKKKEIKKNANVKMKWLEAERRYLVKNRNEKEEEETKWRKSCNEADDCRKEVKWKTSKRKERTRMNEDRKNKVLGTKKEGKRDR